MFKRLFCRVRCTNVIPAALTQSGEKRHPCPTKRYSTKIKETLKPKVRGQYFRAPQPCGETSHSRRLRRWWPEKKVSGTVVSNLWRNCLSRSINTSQFYEEFRTIIPSAPSILICRLDRALRPRRSLLVQFSGARGCGKIVAAGKNNGTRHLCFSDVLRSANHLPAIFSRAHSGITLESASQVLR